MTISSSGNSGSSTHRHADLVLDGGGILGIGHVGAITTLDAAGYRFERIAGTSVGAIVGSVVAALKAADQPISRLDRHYEYDQIPGILEPARSR
jgi:predicted acylesterase/phospholipase RssA